MLLCMSISILMCLDQGTVTPMSTGAQSALQKDAPAPRLLALLRTQATLVKCIRSIISDLSCIFKKIAPWWPGGHITSDNGAQSPMGFSVAFL
jgi:hypothetical protein